MKPPSPLGRIARSGQVLFQMMRADVLERTRRYSFVITLGLMIVLAFAYVPSRDSGFISLSVDGARGVYNSAWVGSLVAILMGMTMPALGFYLVKNAVARDQETGVGQIIATTPLRRPTYTLGKWLSNFVVLAAMVGVTAVAAALWQLLLGESARLDLVALWSPIVWVVLPTMALVAALAVLFETISWLRGGLGNIVYFFLCTAAVMASFMPVMLAEPGLGVAPPAVDLFGIGRPLAAMLQATSEAFPYVDWGNNSIGPIPDFLAGPLQTFDWPGVAWTPAVMLGRLLWIGVAVALALLAALFFDRFDPARGGLRRTSHKKGRTARAHAGLSGQPARPVPAASQPVVQPASLTAAARTSFSFGRVLLAELRLMAKDLRWWWVLVAAGLAVAGFLVPAGSARQYVLAFTWLWPILAWSALGAREVRYRTAQLAFSAAHPLGRQLPATWLAGSLLAALTGSGVALSLLRGGDGAGLLAWLAAVLFIPALAVALAVWTGSSKFFEVAYLTLWYFGPLNQILPQADFMGAGGAEPGRALAYLFAALALLGAAVAGRQRQLYV